MRVIKNWKLMMVFLIIVGFCRPTISALTEDEKNTISVVKQSANSVVFVTNIQLVRDFFFQEEQVARGSGSGFVWDNKGHIVTNYHVIEEGDIFAVTLPNQQHRKARLVGKEINKDIAVLRIEGDLKGLFPLKVGSSKILQVGQKVVAIGNPFGFSKVVINSITKSGDSRQGVFPKCPVLSLRWPN